MSAPVFLADPAVLDVYVPGSRYVLEGVEARHAGVVQRRRPGERVDVVDGRGVRLECRIAAVDPGRLLSLIHISEPTRRTPISYAVFCLKKKKRKKKKKTA